MRSIFRILAAMLCVTAVARAQAQKKSPVSKLYVADQLGDTQIDTGTEIADLTKKSVYNAEGTAIETKANSNTSVVLSNGAGIYFDVNTRVQVRTFKQEAFKPEHSDIDDEPSLSTTHLYIEHGVIGVSSSKMAPGSTTVYETPMATATIRGRQAVIQSQDNLTVISMVQGEATVQTGPSGRPIQVKNHQQVIVRPGKPGEDNVVEIRDIPDGGFENEIAWLEERVLTADAARKLVYFEVQVRKGSNDITLFDGNSATGADASTKEIVPVPVVQAVPTVQPNVSPANLTSG